MKVTIKRELLTYLHHEQKLSLARMGKLLGLKEEAVFKFMKINKINIFFHDEVLMEAPKKVTQKEDGIVVKRIIPAPQCAKRLTAEIKMKLKNEAWLKEEIKKTSKSEVARKLGVASTTINHYLKKMIKRSQKKDWDLVSLP